MFPPHLAFLADAHLRDGNDRTPEALALARAVAEIRALSPAPDLVLFAGDLAHNGNPQALELGKEILADLPAPLVPVMGEGDGMGQGATAWLRLFGAPGFSLRYEVFHLLGLHTALAPSPQGPVFEVGREQRRWLGQELRRLSPDLPLIVLSHAPLKEIFRPWQQWTKDGPEVMRLLSRFSQVYCFHGHVHREAGSYQLSDFSYGGLVGSEPFNTENRKQKTENLPLPATSWPLPSPLQGGLAAPRPGLGPHGCGWTLVSWEKNSLNYQPQVWRA
jgi:3',5'-cyclic AMP phosphodiesterase CpdA